MMLSIPLARLGDAAFMTFMKKRLPRIEYPAAPSHRPIGRLTRTPTHQVHGVSPHGADSKHAVFSTGAGDAGRRHSGRARNLSPGRRLAAARPRCGTAG